MKKLENITKEERDSFLEGRKVEKLFRGFNDLFAEIDVTELGLICAELSLKDEITQEGLETTKKEYLIGTEKSLQEIKQQADKIYGAISNLEAQYFNSHIELAMIKDKFDQQLQKSYEHFNKLNLLKI